MLRHLRRRASRVRERESERGKVGGKTDIFSCSYMARNWAIPTLDHFVQCKGVKKAVMSHTQMIGGRNRLFRHTWSQNQRNTNKAIHNIMFKHLERHTVAKPHFVPKVVGKKRTKEKKNNFIILFLLGCAEGASHFNQPERKDYE